MRWVLDYWEGEGWGAAFEMQQALDGMGFPRTHRKHATVRDWIRNYFARSRKEFAGIAEYFFSEPKYGELIQDGLGEKEIWKKVWDVCVEFGLLPLWSDGKDGGRYKPMQGVHYVRLKERRGGAIASEVYNTVQALEILFPKFPSLPGVYDRPQLEADGLFLALPPGITCEQCGLEFVVQGDFARHYNDEHAYAS